MQSNEKITQKESRLNEVQLSCNVNAFIDLHALTVRVSQEFYLSKEFKKHAWQLTKAISKLQPKPASNLKAC